jgi:hypothetical protein
MEMFLGRSVSVSRDLGGKCGGRPIPFGSRCEFFEGTDNTLRDRTRPGIWLGAKSNAYGSAWFFAMDTETVLSREQWTYLPMDRGTVNLMNKIAERKPMLPKNLRMIYKGAELVGDEPDDDGDDAEIDEAGEKVVTDTAADMPWGGVVDDVGRVVNEEDDVIGVNDSPESLSDPSAQLESAEDVHQPANQQATRDSSGGVGAAAEYHHPEPVARQSRQVPESPWFLAGSPVRPTSGEGRPRRERRAPERFDPSAYLTETVGLDHETEDAATEAATERILSMLDGHAGDSQMRPLVEADRSLRNIGGHSAYIISVERALKTAGLADSAKVAIKKDMAVMDVKEVFEGVDWTTLTTEQKKRVIRSSMFLKEKLLPQGAEPVGSTPEEFAAFYKSEYSRWGKLVRQNGIKGE